MATTYSRATKVEVEERRAQLLAIVEDGQPMTVRQVFYQATVKGIVKKTEAGYTSLVQPDLTLLRRTGKLPYDWLVDNSRTVHRSYTFDSVAEALEDAARTYLKSLWTNMPVRVQVWLEKDALAGVIEPVTRQYDVPLFVARGYASLSFLHDAAEDINDLDVPVYIFHLGDYDPSGVNAGEAIDRTLREMAPDAEIHFERIAVTQEQIRDWDLPTRPTKTEDTRAAKFGEAESVELDAIDPQRLRDLVQEAIERHMPAETYEALMQEQDEERDAIREAVDKMQEE
jgi:hypothetical protein